MIVTSDCTGVSVLAQSNLCPCSTLPWDPIVAQLGVYHAPIAMKLLGPVGVERMLPKSGHRALGRKGWPIVVSG